MVCVSHFHEARELSEGERPSSARAKPINAGRLDSQFNIEKLVHCFLNQAGLSTIGEAEFHLDRFIERSLMARGYYDALERLKKVEAQVRQLCAEKAAT